MMWEALGGTQIPFTVTEEKNEETGTTTFTARCKFCTFASASEFGRTMIVNDVIAHAKNPDDGNHYDYQSGLFYSAHELQIVREQRRERRRILGSHEDTMNLNQGGL